MNIKEQENQLVLGMNFRIVVSILIWSALVGYASYNIWSLLNAPVKPSLNLNSVPTIKQENLDTLRTSIKASHPSTDNLPIVRPEPFD